MSTYYTLVLVLTFDTYGRGRGNNCRIDDMDVQLICPRKDKFRPIRKIDMALGGASNDAAFDRSAGTRKITIFRIPRNVCRTSTSSGQITSTGICLFGKLGASIGIARRAMRTAVGLRVSLKNSILVGRLCMKNYPGSSNSNAFTVSRCIILCGGSSRALSVDSFTLNVMGPCGPRTSGGSCIGNRLFCTTRK